MRRVVAEHASQVRDLLVDEAVRNERLKRETPVEPVSSTHTSRVGCLSNDIEIIPPGWAPSSSARRPPPHHRCLHLSEATWLEALAYNPPLDLCHGGQCRRHASAFGAQARALREDAGGEEEGLNRIGK